MATEWFYQAKGQQCGPVASSELRRLADAGAIMPDTLVCRATATRMADGRWVRAEEVQGLFQRSAPASPPSPASSPPLPESDTPNRSIGGESSIRHGLRAAAAGELPEKPERIWPLTWAAIIVGSGTVLLVLWALVFRGDSARHEEANLSKPAEEREVVWTPDSRIPPPAGNWWDEDVKRAQAAVAPAAPSAPSVSVKPGLAESNPLPATDGVTALDLADLAELVGPSVVQLNVRGPETAATGSGFVLDKQGTIVTNYHVIQDATEGTVVFSDKTSAPITGYLGAWPEKDIAIVRVECPPDKLRPLRLATSSPRQGERVAAFGSPLGLAQSMSEGIVSAVRQSEELGTLVPMEVNALLIQTTTPISHGNSGDPLVDMKGMVVGVNTITFQPLGGENLNFAVAAAEVSPLLWGKSKSPSPLPVNDTGQSTVNGVRRIVGRGWAHVIAGDLDEAIADFTEAIRLDPEHAKTYCVRGVAYARKGDYDQAIADYTEAIRLDPKDWAAYGGRGIAYQWKHDYDQAIADFTEALQINPNIAGAHCDRGNAYVGKGDYDQAIADYTEAIRLDPANGEAYWNRGLAYRTKGKLSTAQRDFAQAKKLGHKP
ncbi:MAG: tetratricopeptide repeat protein [Planctomycetia bacterium]|nr:tetratricopeptide repeat protein [Planctomycetia bacterium]